MKEIKDRIVSFIHNTDIDIDCDHVDYDLVIEEMREIINEWERHRYQIPCNSAM